MGNLRREASFYFGLNQWDSGKTLEKFPELGFFLAEYEGSELLDAVKSQVDKQAVYGISLLSIIGAENMDRSQYLFAKFFVRQQFIRWIYEKHMEIGTDHLYRLDFVAELVQVDLIQRIPLHTRNSYLESRRRQLVFVNDGDTGIVSFCPARSRLPPPQKSHWVHNPPSLFDQEMSDDTRDAVNMLPNVVFAHSSGLFSFQSQIAHRPTVNQHNFSGVLFD